MRLMLDFSIVPIGVGTSLSPYVAACQKVLEESGLTYRMHGYGTNVEGEWDDVMAAVRRCHEVVHAMGAPRITTSVRMGTRTDRAQSIDDKIESVRRRLDAD